MATQHVKLSKDLCSGLQEFRQLRKSNNEVQRKINITQEKLSSGAFQEVLSGQEDSSIDTEYNDLREMYQTALEQSKKEQDVLFLICTKLQDLIEVAHGEENKMETTSDNKQPGITEPPLKKQKKNTPATPTANPTVSAGTRSGKKTVQEAGESANKQKKRTDDADTYLGNTEDLLKPGEKVAAKASDSGDWILGSVVKYLADKKKYEIEDEDDDSNRKRYKLNKRLVVGLPRLFDASKVFPKGSQVLAMFPNTTTFYPAIVDREPNKQNNFFYMLRFEDDEEDGKVVSRKVTHKHVIPMQNVR
ncbi:hypothetical protein AKO1_001626 [Acrasis kona]|uniref:SGF29 C-terminal domain-containing protein n=1 Tax=Acrasis kona TaxID=1008807 RepID=A0AAW2ZBP0_9EUKA